TLVFTAPSGGAIRHHNFYSRQFRPAVRRAVAQTAGQGQDGFPEGLRFHDLRHTCAALLVAQGAHPRAIMERLGHSSISVTLNTYGHLFPSVDEALTDRLDSVFNASRPSATGSGVAREWHGAA